MGIKIKGIDMGSPTKPISKKKIKETTTKKEYKPIPNMTEESVSDINFFKEDIDEMNRQYYETEKLYGEIHKLFSDTTGGDYMPTRNLKDVAELTKALTSTRTLAVDIINKRTGIKKIISDVVAKRKGNDTENDVITETARRIVECVNGQSINATAKNAITTEDGTKFVKPAVDQSSSGIDDTTVLDKSIEKAIKKGDIVMTKNDKFIAIADHIVPKYDKDKNKIVAVDTRDGKVVKGFPEERLPNGEISAVEADRIRLNSGEIINFLDSED